jgi:hypothetical protein
MEREMEPTISKTLWTDSPEFVALQERVKEIDALADILMAVIGEVGPHIGIAPTNILLNQIYHLRERLKE